ncbi:MAG: DUF305 domain-containing protein [bacterium]|nr:DUF305 domain-containing protein [bacterium]
MNNNNSLLYHLGGVALGGALVWFLIGNNTQNLSNRVSMMGFRDQENAGTTNPGQVMAGTIDAHFIEQMIPHHEDAITMAKLAQTKAKRPEVKLLANSIIESQGQEITQMKSWYQEWYGRELPTGDQVMNQHGMMGSNEMHMGVRGDQTDMTNLEQAVDFDTEFVREMITHHQMAVMMTSMLKNGTNRPEMIKLADDIITAQTSEIELMRGWLNEWEE